MEREHWRVIELGPHSFCIERGKDRLLVGSIDLNNGRWHVEILWSGHDGPIRADFPEYVSTLAFVKGVEAAFARQIHGHLKDFDL